MLAPLVGLLGVVLALVGSTLDWAAITSATSSSADGAVTLDVLSYGGLMLFEGRLVLIAAVGVLLLGAAMVLLAARRRPLPQLPSAVALVGLGFVIVAVTLTTAIGHPSFLSTFVHSFSRAGDTRLQIPTRAGVWVAMAGGIAVLASGILAGWRRPVQEPEAFLTDAEAAGER